MLEVIHSAHRDDDGETLSNGPIEGDLRIDAASLLPAFPGPAFVVEVGGGIRAANARAGALIARLMSGGAESLAEAIAASVGDRCPRHERLALPAGGGETTVELTVLPLAGTADRAEELLVIGRDSTLERNFTKALLVSRQLFKDLVTCSADFAWETDGEGRFTFVSPRGALGYGAHELDGRLARSLLDADHDDGTPFPFESGEAHDGVELRLVRRDGTSARLEVSSVPAQIDAGGRRGVRGVCRDVTETREREAALAQARDRERLLGAIIDAMRSEIEPARMLEAAAGATAEAVEARYCWILRRTEDRPLATAAEHVGAAGRLPEDLEAAVSAALGAPEIGEDDESAPVDIEAGGMRVLAGLGRYQGCVTGVICLARAQGAAQWSAEDRGLVAGVAAHLGIAAAQIAGREALERLSRTDDLTGLLNRRAFAEDATLRLDHHRRYGRHSALLYIDLDNFKAVNDVRGHHAGDAVLRRLGADLARSSRAGDLAARLGGDEFALWLAETGIEGGLAKAESLLAGAAWLADRSADSDRRLGASIGVAVHDADGGETFDAFLARADGAMYAAKRVGKSAIVLAEDGPRTEGKDEVESAEC